MLVPAVAYKEQIEHNADLLRYSENMMFYNGCTETGRIQIQVDPTEGRYQWAIVDKDELVGYISYMIDYYSSNVYGFGLIAFVDNHKAIASGVLQAIRHIKSMNPHRIEWRSVADNPARYKYVGIMEKAGGKTNVSRLHDVFKDAYGKYHDICIFEIVKEG